MAIIDGLSLPDHISIPGLVSAAKETDTIIEFDTLFSLPEQVIKTFPLPETSPFPPITVPGIVSLKLTSLLNMQELANSILNAFPKDPSLTLVGITVPLLNVECPDLGIINPISDIKEAVAKLYSQGIKSIFQPIWTILYKLYSLLKKFGLGVIDLKLPVFNLKVSDLFSDDLPGRIKIIIANLYYNAKDELTAALKILNIPYELFTEIRSPQKEIEAISTQVSNSLWSSLFKLVSKIIGFIQTGLLAYDIVKLGLPFPTAPIWKAAIKAVLSKVLSFITTPPSIDDILGVINTYARAIYGRVPTYAELMAVMKDFKLPFFGSPFDWILPINIKVNMPNVDFVQLLNDIKSWVNNYLVSLLAKFIKLVSKILKLFGLSFVIPSIPVPFIFCAIKTLES